MAYLPETHYCCYCGRYLGMDNGDGICCECESTHCSECGGKLAHNNTTGVCWHCSGRKPLPKKAIAKGCTEFEAKYVV